MSFRVYGPRDAAQFLERAGPFLRGDEGRHHYILGLVGEQHVEAHVQCGPFSYRG